MALYSLLLIDRMVSVTRQWSRRWPRILSHRAANGLPWRPSPITRRRCRRWPMHTSE